MGHISVRPVVVCESVVVVDIIGRPGAPKVSVPAPVKVDSAVDAVDVADAVDAVDAVDVVDVVPVDAEWVVCGRVEYVIVEVVTVLSSVTVTTEVYAPASS